MNAETTRRAAVVGDIQTVHAGLDAGVAVDEPCSRGYTALHHAAWYGYTDILRLLLERGANPERFNDRGATPLFHATSRGHTEAVRVLLAGGANPNNQIEGHNAPLHAASTHTEIALLLLNAGANIGAVGADNMTLFAYALLEGDAEAARFWAERNAPAHVPMQRKTRGILIFRVRENVEKMAIVRVHALEIAAEMDRAKSFQFTHFGE